MSFKGSCLAVALSVVSLASVSRAAAIPATFSGNFTFDNDVVLFQVNLPIAESLLAYTTSAAGGGFPPYLILWDGTGSQIDQFNGGEPTCSDGYSTPRPGVGCQDTFVFEGPFPSIYLAAGTYFVGLAQADNFSLGDMSAGFTEDGAANQNYTNSLGFCGSGTVLFCDQFAGFTQDSWPQLPSLLLPLVCSAVWDCLPPCCGSGVPSPSNAALMKK